MKELSVVRQLTCMRIWIRRGCCIKGKRYGK